MWAVGHLEKKQRINMAHGQTLYGSLGIDLSVKLILHMFLV